MQRGGRRASGSSSRCLGTLWRLNRAQKRLLGEIVGETNVDDWRPRQPVEPITLRQESLQFVVGNAVPGNETLRESIL